MTKTQRRLYHYLVENAKHNQFHITTKKDLASSLNVSVSTITTNLKKLEQEHKISTASKKGNNGGIVVTIIKDYNTPDLLSFNETSENIIQSNLDYAESLRDKHFPTYQYKRNYKRMSKVELVKYNAIKDAQKKALEKVNFYSNQVNYPTKDIFNMAYDPEGYYKAYILCKLYDQYTIAHLDAKYHYHIEEMQKSETTSDKDSHKKRAEFYRTKMIENMPRNSTPKDFFKSSTFTVFYKLYFIFQKEDLNIFKYMQNVFKNITFEYENGSKPSPIPRPNFFISEKYITNYKNYLKGIRRGVNKTNRHLGSIDMRINSSDYIKNPTVKLLHQLYNTPLNSTIHDIDTMFRTALDIDNMEYGLSNSQEQLILLAYNDMVENKLVSLPSEEKDTINRFIKQNLINLYSPETIPNTARLSMFTMQREYLISSIDIERKVTKDDLLTISLLNSNIDLTPLSKNNLVLNGSEYMYLRKYTSTYSILRMFSDFLGYEVNLRDVKEIIEKYDLSKYIPLTKEGMLAYNEIKKLVEEEVSHE